MSQSGSRHCWVERRVLLDLLIIPRLSICCLEIKSSSYLRFFWFISKVFLPAVQWLILANIVTLLVTLLALFSHYSRFEYELKSLDLRVYTFNLSFFYTSDLRSETLDLRFLKPYIQQYLLHIQYFISHYIRF